ncbi:MAG: hypothetical protein AAFX05_01425, partial [Planctomycetota bacterium]
MIDLLLALLIVAIAALPARPGRSAVCVLFVTAGVTAGFLIPNVNARLPALWVLAGLPALVAMAWLGFLILQDSDPMARASLKRSAAALAPGLLLLLMALAGRIGLVDANLVILSGLAWVWLMQDEDETGRASPLAVGAALACGAGVGVLLYRAGGWPEGAGAAAIVALLMCLRSLRAPRVQHMRVLAWICMTAPLALASFTMAFIGRAVLDAMRIANALDEPPLAAAIATLAARPVVPTLGVLAPDALLLCVPPLICIVAPAMGQARRRLVGGLL